MLTKPDKPSCWNCDRQFVCLIRLELDQLFATAAGKVAFGVLTENQELPRKAINQAIAKSCGQYKPMDEGY